MKVNGKEVKWEDCSKDDCFLTDVKVHVLWRDEKTGASMRLLKVPVGDAWELPHQHPGANQWAIILSGLVDMTGGAQMAASGDDIFFGYGPKGETHGPPRGSKVIKEMIGIQYLDGPGAKVIK